MRAQSGFTLLEIMVVVVLIALTVVFINLDTRVDESRVAETEARRIAALIDHAVHESVYAARPIALVATLPLENDEGVTLVFHQLRSDGWKPVEGDDVLRQRILRPDVSLGVEEGVASNGEEDLAVISDADGNLSPFRWIVSSGQAGYVITTLENRVIVSPYDEKS